MGVVELLLFAFHVSKHAFFQLVRQVGENVLLQSSQDKRVNHFLQPSHGGFVLTLHDGNLNLCPETLVAI